MATVPTEGYTIRTKTDLLFDEAVKQTREALLMQGFSVMCETDIRAMLKEKLDVDCRPYTVLGAYNPRLVDRALDAELEIGVFLPFSVIVYDEDGGAVVAAENPEAMVSMIGNPDFAPVAAEIAIRLRQVLDDVSPKE